MTDSFEKWIQESAPGSSGERTFGCTREVSGNRIKKEAHWAVLKERLRQREKQYQIKSRRKLRSSMVVVVLMIVFVGGYWSPLGSDGFHMKILAPDEWGMVFTEYGHRGSAISFKSGTSLEDKIEIAHQLELRLAKPVTFSKVAYGGGEYWSITHVPVVNGVEYAKAGGWPREVTA